MRIELTSGTQLKTLYIVVQNHNEIELMDDEGIMEYANNLYEANVADMPDLDKPNTVEHAIFTNFSILEEEVYVLDDYEKTPELFKLFAFSVDV